MRYDTYSWYFSGYKYSNFIEQREHKENETTSSIFFDPFRMISSKSNLDSSDDAEMFDVGVERPDKGLLQSVLEANDDGLVWSMTIFTIRIML